MRPRPYKPIHKGITTVATSDLQAIQGSNRALRKALIEKQNELLAREGNAEQHRQLLAGALSILLWGPVRVLVRVLEGRIRKDLGLPKGFARKAADVLHFEEQRRRRKASFASTSGSGRSTPESGEGDGDGAEEAQEAPAEEEREG